MHLNFRYVELLGTHHNHFYPTSDAHTHTHTLHTRVLNYVYDMYMSPPEECTVHDDELELEVFGVESWGRAHRCASPRVDRVDRRRPGLALLLRLPLPPGKRGRKSLWSRLRLPGCVSRLSDTFLYL